MLTKLTINANSIPLLFINLVGQLLSFL